MTGEKHIQYHNKELNIFSANLIYHMKGYIQQHKLNEIQVLVIY